MSGIAVYFIIAMLLKKTGSLDILIPCLWKSIFHFNCLGCGLTTAMLKILHLDFYGALQANPLIYLILPAGLLYVIHDFLKFRTKENEVLTGNIL